MAKPTTIQKWVRGRNRQAGVLTGITPTSPISTIAYDTFTDADGTNLTAHTMNVGAGWTSLAGTMTIQSNTAVCQSATTIYVTQCSQPDVTIYCDIKCGAANGNFAPSILLHAVDGSNYFQVYFSGDSTFAIYQKIAGVGPTLFNGGGVWTADTNWHSAKVVCQDTHIQVWLDSVLLWEGNIPQLAGSTKFGLLGFVNAGSKDSFDNFKVVANSRINTFPGEEIANSFTDTFTQANGTRLNTLGWTENAGTWEVNSNKARQTGTSAPTNGYVVSRDVGLSDNFGISVEITTPTTGGFICGLVFRMVDLNHYVECEFNSGSQGGFGIWYTNNSGAYIELARQNLGGFTPAANTTYTMRARVKGRLIIAEVVEASLKLVTYCDQFMEATKVGIFEFRHVTNYPNNNAYDNFKVYQ